MKKTKISIVIPVYNEEKTVSFTLRKIKETIKDLDYNFEIIAVDDFSKDKSKEILKKIKGIRVIEHTKNKGYGGALKTGIKEAKSKWILITDADGTYPIKDIPRLLNYIDKYDMVVGARIGKKVSIPLLRRPAKWFLRKLASYLANTKIPDLNSGLRIFKKKIAVRFWDLFPQGFSFTSTITMACLTNNYEVKYITINYNKRKGKSTIHPIKDFVGFNSLLLRLVTYFNPMKVFVPIALILFVGSLVKGFIDYLGVGHVGSASVAFFLAAIQISLLGLVSELIIKRTNVIENLK